MIPRFVVGVIALIMASRPCAQRVQWLATGVPGKSLLYEIPSVTGDIDGDGWPDVVDVALETRGTMPRLTCLKFLSGKDGHVLRTRFDEANSTSYKTYYSRAFGVADFDGDGQRDYATLLQEFTAPFDWVEVRSSQNDRLIWRVSGHATLFIGRNICGDADVDGDGKADLVFTAIRPVLNAPQYGALHFYDHYGNLIRRLDGTLLYQIPYSDSYRCMARYGDYDHDGYDDIVVSGANLVIGNAGCTIISGRDGSYLKWIVGTQPFDGYGQSTDICGDVDRDGVMDIVMGSGEGFTTGAVGIFSGATGLPLREWRAADVGNRFEGWSVSGGGYDFNGDSVPDITVASPKFDNGTTFYKNGAVFVLSGADGRVLYKWARSGEPFVMAGLSVCNYGYWPGTRQACFLGSHDISTTTANQGAMMMYRADADILPYGSGCAGALAKMPFITSHDQGPLGMRLTMTEGAPGASAVCMIGTSNQKLFGVPLPYSMAALGMPGCSLLTSTDIVVPTRTGTASFDVGFASVDLPLSFSSFLPGQSLYVQWWCLGAPSSPSLGGMTAGNAFVLR